MNTEFEIQVTLKKGNDWINITQWTHKENKVMLKPCVQL